MRGHVHSLSLHWRAYRSIFRIRMIAGLQYRVAALAGVGINLFYGLILVTILIIFYTHGARQTISMTLAQGVTYIWFAQAFISLIPMSMDAEAYKVISSGDFAYELCRPLDLYSHWYMRLVAMRLSNTLMRSWMVLVVSGFLPGAFRMLPPVSGLALGATVLALFGALLLSCAFTNLMNTFLLRVELGPGLNNLMVTFTIILSGMVIPLAVFPDWLQPVLRALPFAGLMDFPAGLYTGVIPLRQAWGMLGRQVFWIAVLVVLGRWRMNRGLRRTVIQGG